MVSKRKKKVSIKDRREKALLKLSENIRKPKPKPVGKVLIEAGYSETYSKKPSNFFAGKKVNATIADFIPKEELFGDLNRLRKAHRLEHMVFPLAVPKEEIEEMLREVGCTPKRFMIGETAVHCWFWSPDNKALKDAIDMGLKVYGEYTAEKHNPEDPISSLEDADLMAEIRRRESDLKKKL